MAKDRTASEVLLELERKVDWLVKQFNVLDANIKLVLNHLNAAPPHPQQPKIQLPQRGTAPIQTTVAQPATSEPISAETSTVYQKIAYSDSRPVILASVKIADNDLRTNIVAQTRTDSHGKWKVEKLPGGKYFVTVIKGPTAAQPGFKEEYEIVVPGGVTTELERRKIG